VYEQSSHGLHGKGKVLGSIGIEALCQGGKGRVGFAGIHIGPCGTVHDGIDALCLHHLHDSLAVGNVQEGGFLSLHLVDVGENIFVCTVLGKQAHFGTQLAVGSGNKYLHILYLILEPT
jgi:hypothetical protein